MFKNKRVQALIICVLSLFVLSTTINAQEPGTYVKRWHKTHTPTASPSTPIIDTPGNHGMFMVGTNTLYLLHMPMFTTEKHMYQVILQASLPEEIMEKYQTLRKNNPTTAYNLINVEDDTFTLPSLKAGEVTAFKADVFDGYSNDGGGTPGKRLWHNVDVTVDAVVYFRHFNFNFNYPENLTYILFGDGTETHMTHYLSRDPDFQHILTLSQTPTWLSATQMKAGVGINIIGTSSTPIPCTNPLPETAYQVLFEGRKDTENTLELGTNATVWFSTGNLLNNQDPCAKE